ncbi:hypothetical protein NQ317_015005 [Molorchus minor]|uniref:Uncharacterized protein n=1 Tax=Molorchus minor TaxID=1323400 RepID=A0ABQ9K613_9CUCU|nr:hypothetical protein NQ317_015005 [Molorchus minor]
MENPALTVIITSEAEKHGYQTYDTISVPLPQLIPQFLAPLRHVFFNTTLTSFDPVSSISNCKLNQPAELRDLGAAITIFVSAITHERRKKQLEAMLPGLARADRSRKPKAHLPTLTNVAKQLRGRERIVLREAAPLIAPSCAQRTDGATCTVSPLRHFHGCFEILSESEYPTTLGKTVAAFGKINK